MTTCTPGRPDMWQESNRPPNNTIPSPKSQKTLDLHGPPEKGTTRFHRCKSCGRGGRVFNSAGQGADTALWLAPPPPPQGPPKFLSRLTPWSGDPDPKFHYCRSRDFTTRRAPTPPDASYIPDASGPDTLYDTVRRVVHPRRVGPQHLVRHSTTRRTVDTVRRVVQCHPVFPSGLPPQC